MVFRKIFSCLPLDSACLASGPVCCSGITGPKTPTEQWHKHSKEKYKPLPDDGSLNVEFPPAPPDRNLSRSIIEKACSQMKSQNISETGCAVFGELKPLCGMSQLKAIKQQLHVLTVSGISHIECKDSSSPLREYKGLG